MDRSRSRRRYAGLGSIHRERPDTPAARHAVHHFSHRNLLTPVTGTPAAVPVDAIVVPSGRAATSLDHLVRLAGELKCQLLVLCSRLAKAKEVATRALPGDAAVVAIDVAALRPRLPAFRTTALLKGGSFDRRTDTSFKRNLGLLIARSAGWERIAFLDDDITVADADDLRHAAGLAGTYDIVGLSNDGFPDNSVVCHANRTAGGDQDTFIGGGALVLNPMRTTSFFPDIYNEDWFFLLDEARIGSVGMFGTMTQKSYDPFADPRRARGEELGDCLAEGVYSLLDQGGTVRDAEDVGFWHGFLAARDRLIDDVIERAEVSAIDPAEKRRVLAALHAAQVGRARIKPRMCVAYLQAWRADRELWKAHVRRMARRGCLCAALQEVRIPKRAIRGVLPFRPEVPIGCSATCRRPRIRSWIRDRDQRHQVSPGLSIAF